LKPNSIIPGVSSSLSDDHPYKYQGRTLRQLKRIGMVAIYELRNQGELLYGYEVVRIKVSPAEEMFGKSYPERELYPSSSDLGTIAWSFGRTQKIEALAMFNGLVKKERFRPQQASKRCDLVAPER
jgi:hypothetical protein